MKDLKKMPVISELLSDSKHCANFSYLFELFSCGDSSCKFGCEAWPEAEEGSAEAALHAELKKRTPLPRMGKDGHFKSYEESCKLCENDERDLPSAKESMPKEMLKKMKALDKAKSEIFVVSKMRDAIICIECRRPRLVYSLRKPKKKLVDAFDSYKEGIDYCCGDALFDEEAVAESDATLKLLSETYHVKRIHTCRDVVESTYFNYSNVRGCADLEWVCSRCGAGPEDSPLDPKTCGKGDVTGYGGFAMSEGRMVLPMCTGCRSKKFEPILVGTTSQVEKKRERQAAKQAARAKKQKAPAADDLMSEDEVEPGQSEGGASGSGVPTIGSNCGHVSSARCSVTAALPVLLSVGRSCRGQAGSQRSQPVPTQNQNLSTTSGASKKRTQKERAAAQANPKSLSNLILEVLPSFKQRSQQAIYVSLLRLAVEKADKAKRKFKDRSEWQAVLLELHMTKKLTYCKANNTFTLGADGAAAEGAEEEA